MAISEDLYEYLGQTTLRAVSTAESLLSLDPNIYESRYGILVNEDAKKLHYNLAFNVNLLVAETYSLYEDIIESHWQGFNAQEKSKFVDRYMAMWFETVLLHNEVSGADGDASLALVDDVLFWITRISSILYNLDQEPQFNELVTYAKTFLRTSPSSLNLRKHNVTQLRIFRALGHPSLKNFNWDLEFEVFSEAELFGRFPSIPFNGFGQSITINSAISATFREVNSTWNKKFLNTQNFQTQGKSKVSGTNNGGCLLPIISVIAPLLLILVL